jgi:hypothetical protein
MDLPLRVNDTRRAFTDFLYRVEAVIMKAHAIHNALLFREGCIPIRHSMNIAIK